MVPGGDLRPISDRVKIDLDRGIDDLGLSRMLNPNIRVDVDDERPAWLPIELTLAGRELRVDIHAPTALTTSSAISARVITAFLGGGFAALESFDFAESFDGADAKVISAIPEIWSMGLSVPKAVDTLQRSLDRGGSVDPDVLERDMPTDDQPIAIQLGEMLSGKASGGGNGALDRWVETVRLAVGLDLEQPEINEDGDIGATDAALRFRDVRYPLGPGPVGEESFVPDEATRLQLLGVEVRPLTYDGASGAIVASAADRARLEAADYLPLGPLEYILDRSAAKTIALAPRLLTVTRLAAMLKSVADQGRGFLVGAALERFSLVELRDLLRMLMRESVSIESLGAILESALRPEAPEEAEEQAATVDYLHSARIWEIIKAQSRKPSISVLSVSDAYEDWIEKATPEPDGGDEHREFVASAAQELANFEFGADRPFVVAKESNRRLVFELLELEFPGLQVLSYEEIPPTAAVYELGKIA